MSAIANNLYKIPLFNKCREERKGISHTAIQARHIPVQIDCKRHRALYDRQHAPPSVYHISQYRAPRTTHYTLYTNHTALHSLTYVTACRLYHTALAGSHAKHIINHAPSTTYQTHHTGPYHTTSHMVQHYALRTRTRKNTHAYMHIDAVK